MGRSKVGEEEKEKRKKKKEKKKNVVIFSKIWQVTELHK